MTRDPGKRNVDVFLVEPDLETLGAMERLVASLDLSFASARDGRRAVSALKQLQPRCVVVELLLPGVDGFEVCQSLRTVHQLDCPLLCVSAVSWGHMDLSALLRKRFDAAYLKKPFSATELLEALCGLLGIIRPDELDDMPDLILGASEVSRTEDLAKEFESRVARAGLPHSRRAVRAEQEFLVEFENLGQLVQEYTHNISAGGLFIRSGLLPSPGEIIDLTVALPHMNRTVETKARVVHLVSPEQAEAEGTPAGFGVEFVDLAADDRQLLKKLVSDLQQLQKRGDEAAPSFEPPTQGPLWVLLLGVETVDPLLQGPSFLHRGEIEICAFPSLDAAEDFLAVHHVALCMVHETIFEGSTPKAELRRLAEMVSPKTQRIALCQDPIMPQLLEAGLCEGIMPPGTAMKRVLEEMRHRLAVSQRSSPRVLYRAPVDLGLGEEQFGGQLINVSAGGVLLRTPQGCAAGDHLRLTFVLPNDETFLGHGQVVRVERNPGARECLVGIRFLELDAVMEERVRRFVQSQVNFREFFGWLKMAYFERGPLSTPAEGDGDRSGRRYRNVFGLE